MTAEDTARAWEVLRALGASPRLIRHAELVHEAAELVVEHVRRLPIEFDAGFVLAGAVLHDAGKAAHPEELTGSGRRHERDGPAILEAEGIPAELARVAVSHAQWRAMECSLEELLVALSDKLWKGARVAELEQLVVSRCAAQLDSPEWEVFMELDPGFEQIAEGGPDRLARAAT